MGRIPAFWAKSSGNTGGMHMGFVQLVYGTPGGIPGGGGTITCTASEDITSGDLVGVFIQSVIDPTPLSHSFDGNPKGQSSISPDDTYIATILDYTPSLKIYKKASGTETYSLLANQPQGVLGADMCAFSPDKTLFAVTITSSILIYKISNDVFTLVQTLNVSTSGTNYSIKFSPDGKWLVRNRYTGSTQLYAINGASATPAAAEISLPDSLSVDFSYDSRYLVSHQAGTSTSIKFYELTSGTAVIAATLTIATNANSGVGTMFIPGTYDCLSNAYYAYYITFSPEKGIVNQRILEDCEMYKSFIQFFSPDNTFCYQGRGTANGIELLYININSAVYPISISSNKLIVPGYTTGSYGALNSFFNHAGNRFFMFTPGTTTPNYFIFTVNQTKSVRKISKEQIYYRYSSGSLVSIGIAKNSASTGSNVTIDRINSLEQATGADFSKIY
jgi:WD40 repeat protein